MASATTVSERVLHRGVGGAKVRDHREHRRGLPSSAGRSSFMRTLRTWPLIVRWSGRGAWWERRSGPRPSAQHLALARGENVERVGPVSGQQRGDHVRVERRAAARDALGRVEEVATLRTGSSGGSRSRPSTRARPRRGFDTLGKEEDADPGRRSRIHCAASTPRRTVAASDVDHGQRGRAADRASQAVGVADRGGHVAPWPRRGERAPRAGASDPRRSRPARSSATTSVRALAGWHRSVSAERRDVVGDAGEARSVGGLAPPTPSSRIATTRAPFCRSATTFTSTRSPAWPRWREPARHEVRAGLEATAKRSSVARTFNAQRSAGRATQSWSQSVVEPAVDAARQFAKSSIARASSRSSRRASAPRASRWELRLEVAKREADRARRCWPRRAGHARVGVAPRRRPSRSEDANSAPRRAVDGPRREGGRSDREPRRADHALEEIGLLAERLAWTTVASGTSHVDRRARARRDRPLDPAAGDVDLTRFSGTGRGVPGWYRRAPVRGRRGSPPGRAPSRRSSRYCSTVRSPRAGTVEPVVDEPLARDRKGRTAARPRGSRRGRQRRAELITTPSLSVTSANAAARVAPSPA